MSPSPVIAHAAIPTAAVTTANAATVDASAAVDAIASAVAAEAAIAAATMPNFIASESVAEKPCGHDHLKQVAMREAYSRVRASGRKPALRSPTLPDALDEHVELLTDICCAQHSPSITAKSNERFYRASVPWPTPGQLDPS